jgi:predicted double-glycine peptidase
VLAALGDERSEAEWASVLGSYEFGTPASRVLRLTELGYQVSYGPSSLEMLQAELAQDRRIIVFVRADLLPWADFGGFHALVMTEITNDKVALHDPTLDHGPSQISMDAFLIAWQEFDCLAAIFSR